MALIKCENCNNEVSDKAAFCTSCGSDLSKPTNSNPINNGLIPLCILGLIIFVIICSAGGLGILLIVLPICVLNGVIWGYATKMVLNNRGYDENWFWWGFFLSFIPIIVAFSKPQISVASSTATNVDSTDNDKFHQVKKCKELLDCGAITEEEFIKKKTELLNL